jgi:hypothetical protein|tara:strand:+ start:4493 stop:4984 length:492 start_codon:yes stop_codon:yes gene_type:complete
MEPDMKFQIEQIAIVPKDPIAAKKLLSEIGATEWSEDHVVATGNVFGVRDTNEADLSFNYDLFSGKEFEVLDYTSGPNWVDSRGERNTVSHLGMHCSAEDLVHWRAFFANRDIEVAQEVFTDSHTNPVIAGKRSYNYVIFDTKNILGVDLKFIVRINKDANSI